MLVILDDCRSHKRVRSLVAITIRVSINDLHATILALLGMDHTKLTYLFNGRNIRLTDVAGEVVKGIIA